MHSNKYLIHLGAVNALFSPWGLSLKIHTAAFVLCNLKSMLHTSASPRSDMTVNIPLQTSIIPDTFKRNPEHWPSTIFIKGIGISLHFFLKITARRTFKYWLWNTPHWIALIYRNNYWKLPLWHFSYTNASSVRQILASLILQWAVYS